MLEILIPAAIGAALGIVLGWFIAKNRFDRDTTEARVKLSASEARADAYLRETETFRESLKERETELKSLSEEISQLKSRRSKLETIIEKEREAAQEKLAILDDAQKKLSSAFESLAKEALKDSNQSFLQLAEQTLKKYQSEAKGELDQRRQAIEGMIKPLQETLKQYNDEIQKVRIAEGSLLDQVKSLQDETKTLSNALKQPQVRGRWGEYTLRRVVELAGMSEYCDFKEQESVKGDGDKRLRPDMVVGLPGNKLIVVDAKTPLVSYLEAMETTDEAKRNNLLRMHAKNVREQVRNLSSKAYWDQFQFTPDFAVMFIPGDHFLSAALKEYPDLFEEAVEHRVLLSTPVNFIALLKTIALIWRQKNMAENAAKISQMGKDIYDRLLVLSSHFAKMGGHLEKSVTSYNAAVKSLESRVLTSARKFKELGLTVKADVPDLKTVDRLPSLPATEEK